MGKIPGMSEDIWKISEEYIWNVFDDVDMKYEINSFFFLFFYYIKSCKIQHTPIFSLSPGLLQLLSTALPDTAQLDQTRSQPVNRY